MANRAYLYSSDQNRDELWDWRERTTYPYCDSRWTIPFAWFFFFAIPDVLLVQESATDTWQEVKFHADKQQALCRFQYRLPTLLRLIGDNLDASHIDSFFGIVSTFPKANLLMDPESIFGGVGGDEEWHFAKCRHIIELIDHTDILLPDIAEALQPYCTVNPIDENNAVGAWYSPNVAV